MKNICIPIPSKGSISIYSFRVCVLYALTNSCAAAPASIAKVIHTEEGVYKLLTYEVQVEHQGALAADDRRMQQSVKTIVEEQMKESDETTASKALR